LLHSSLEILDSDWSVAAINAQICSNEITDHSEKNKTQICM